MPQPTWVTPAGNFGTFNEGSPIAQALVATPVSAGTLTYTLLNSTFPTATSAWTLNPTTGVFTGTAAEVAATEEWPFTVRVYEYLGPTLVGFSDRTFSFSIQGLTQPSFTTPPGPLYPGPTYLPDSTWNPFQILYSNPDPVESAVVRLIGGSLPPGIEIDESGLIRGYASPSNTNYTFTLEVSSPSGVATGSYSIQVVQQTPLTRAPAIQNTRPPTFNPPIGDDDTPYYISSTGLIGTVAQDDYFMFRILGTTFASGSLSYSMSGTLPPGVSNNVNYNSSNTVITILSGGSGYAPGDQLRINGADLGGVTGINDLDFDVLTVDTGVITATTNISGLNAESDNFYNLVNPVSVTGTGVGAVVAINKINPSWINGLISVTPGLDVATYNFSFTALNNTNGLTSSPQAFSVTVVSQESNIPFSTAVDWVSPTDLGVLYNGSTSNLYVEAVSSEGLELTYTLTSGSLPPSLTLDANGLIQGQVAFETAGTLTPADTSINYTFSVTATSTAWPAITTTKTFNLSVYQNFSAPYENLYIKALLSIPDRAILADLLTDTTLFPPAWIYRPNDPNFGLATGLVYRHMYGVTASTIADYITAVEKNHYRRNIILGPLKSAEVVDTAGNVIYEVLYCEIVDNLVNNSGISVSKTISWPYVIPTIDNKVYPASLPNMRTQIENELGQDSQSAVLPEWMTDQQNFGGNLGYQPAWVICYTKPGYSSIIKYNIETPISGSVLVTATDSINDIITCASTAGFFRNMRVQFTGSVFGGVATSVDYFINNIISETQFTVTTTIDGSTDLPLVTAVGQMFIEHISWGYQLNRLTFSVDRFEVSRGLTSDWDPVTETWSTLPSPVDPTDSVDEYIYFNKNILG